MEWNWEHWATLVVWTWVWEKWVSHHWHDLWAWMKSWWD